MGEPTGALSAADIARLEATGIEDAWIASAPNAFLLDKHGLTAEKVAARVRALWT